MHIEKDQVKALAAAGVLLVVFVAAVLLPLRHQRGKYQQRIADAEQALGIDLREARGVSKLNDEVVELRQVVEGAQQYVPQSDELADVLRGLSEALTSHGIIEREMQTKPTTHHHAYSVIPIQLQFHASYPAVHGVLQQIERMRRLIRIDEVKIRGDRADGLAPLSVDLSLSTFIAKPLEAGDG